MKKIDKTFSIVIPVGPNFIEYKNLVDTFSKIDFPSEKFETLIVLDAGSDQTTAQMLYLDLSALGINSKILKNIGLPGPGSARNVGIENSRNRFIIFLDSDDSLKPNIFNTIDAEDSDADVIYFNFKRSLIHPKKSSLRRKDSKFFTNKKSLIEGGLKNQLEQECWQAAYKREFLQSNSIRFPSGFFEDLKFSMMCLTRMSSFSFLDEVLYEKYETSGSITSTITTQSISAHLEAWIEMANFAMSELGTDSIYSLKIGLQNLVGQFVCRIVKQINNSEDPFDLIKHLRIELESQNILTEVASAKNVLPTLYSDIYKFLVTESKTFEEMIAFVNEREKLQWSCRDIENSIFLAPNEIRTCCKRFFVNGKIKGDVVLDLKIDHPLDRTEKILTNQIVDAKNSLKRKINIGNENECSGCPYLELKEWPTASESLDIRYLSMEQHSICNLRCTYCDEKYYGGLKADYDVTATLKDLHKNGVTSNLETVVWGGGEPTLDPNFAEMLKDVSEVAPNCEHRFLSNSKRFSKPIYDALKLGHSQLVTSLDAGSDSKYLQIRGRKGYSDVLRNLSNYSELANHSLVIKYIFTSENQEMTELDNFVNDVTQLHLTKNIFQISYDFKSETIDKTGLIACLYLYARLYNAGANFIYFDDLLLMRLQSGTNLSIHRIIEEIKSLTNTGCFGQPSDYADISLYGAGDQAERILKKFNLLHRFPITRVVENSQLTPHKNFHGMQIQNVDVLISNNSKILLAGVQSIPQMLKNLTELGISNNRIIRELLI